MYTWLLLHPRSKGGLEKKTKCFLAVLLTFICVTKQRVLRVIKPQGFFVLILPKTLLVCKKTPTWRAIRAVVWLPTSADVAVANVASDTRAGVAAWSVVTYCERTCSTDRHCCLTLVNVCNNQHNGYYCVPKKNMWPHFW